MGHRPIHGGQSGGLSIPTCKLQLIVSRAEIDRYPSLVAATAIGVYLLLVLGATTTVTNAATACQTWPGCQGVLSGDGSLDLAIVVSHRLAAVVVGIAVLGVAIATWRGNESRRTNAAVGLATLLYPVQIAVGAVTATTGTPALVSGTHLLLGVAIFTGLVLAVAWSLEERTATLPSAEWDGPARGADEPTPDRSGVTGTIRAYLSLTKPRLMWLLCLVASAGMALAAGPGLRVHTVLFTLLGGVLAIGASGTFNHVFEIDRDRQMDRTNSRPTVEGAITPRKALAFAFVLTTLSIAAFLQVNLLAAGLGVTAILFYSVIYTLVLKPNTVQNTVIGGFAGSLPALIGWAAVTNELGVPALALAGLIFMWTPAHFYNLALAYKDDYAAGGFPMMPVVRGEAETRKHIVYYLGATLLSATLLAAVTDLGALFALTSAALGGVFLYYVVRLHRERDRSAAMRAFHASNAYLGSVLVVIVLDALLV